MELFAILRLADSTIIWAGLSTPEDANLTAVHAAMDGHGAVTLLSGTDLADHIINGASA